MEKKMMKEQHQDMERGARARPLRRSLSVDDCDEATMNGLGLSPSTEQVFEAKALPKWTDQLTFRAFGVSLVIGLFLSFIVMKLNLTTGIVPSLNVSAGLLGFFFVKVWTKALERIGLLRQPFTRQENTVIQTCVVACSGIAFSGGFGSYILGMSSVVANRQDTDYTDAAVNIKEPSLGWLFAFLFTVSFAGLFSVIPLRKVMIVGYKLTYPSGTATAHLINSFHTPQGAHLAKKQVSILFKSFTASFFWSFFQWFFSGGDDCGFSAFPTFGLQAFKHRFYFDFSATYVGVGMICPYIVNVSLLLGAIISWGILWPFITSKRGDWYNAELDLGSLHSLNGYKVFIPIGMILGDGLSNFISVSSRTLYDIYKKAHDNGSNTPAAPPLTPQAIAASFDERRRTTIFLQDQIPAKVAIGGYVALATISVVVVPLISPQLKFYHIVTIYLIAPILAFCNAYGSGLTDWSLASSYGKLAIFIFSAWIGIDRGGLLAGLVACGVMMSIVATASDLMQDFKTGYLTLSSPRSMFVSQVIGTMMGCAIAPIVFWIFYKAFDVAKEGSEYQAPYAAVYRGIALVGAQGFDALPKYCLSFCLAFFLGAFSLNVLRELARYKNWWFHMLIPSAMGMAVPFFVGAYFTIDMCIGSLILFFWGKANKRHADSFAPAVASGLICGDGIWSLPASLLALAKVQPPMCMMFMPRSGVAKVSSILKDLNG